MNDLLGLTRMTAAVLLASLCAGGRVTAQELEPKAYSASPVGLNFLVAGIGRSTGSVVFDPTLPFRDVDARVGALVLGAGRTFDFFGKLALVSAALPVSRAKVTGRVGDDPTIQSVERTGLADARFKVSVNLRGNRAMKPAEFAKTPRRTIVGASLAVQAPIGEYRGTRLINLGTNRWAFKPEVGVSIPRGRWDFDAYAGVWLFTRNPDFYTSGRLRTQDPLTSLQGHASYTFKPRLWLAANGTWYSGGAARVDDDSPTGSVNNSRLGVTLSLPAGRRQSVKISYSSGVSVRTGTDFDAVGVVWQWVWLAR